jgi:hypothetical protein
VPPLARLVSFEHVHVLGPLAEEIVDWCPATEFEKQKMESVSLCTPNAENLQIPNVDLVITRP